MRQVKANGDMSDLNIAARIRLYLYSVSYGVFMIMFTENVITINVVFVS